MRRIIGYQQIENPGRKNLCKISTKVLKDNGDFQHIFFILQYVIGAKSNIIQSFFYH